MPTNAAKKAASIKAKLKSPGHAISGAVSSKKPQPEFSLAHNTTNVVVSPNDNEKDRSDPISTHTFSQACETMHLTFKSLSSHDNCLQSYPIADTIALLLILVNFPRVLITAMHLFYSYKEHLLPASSPASLPPFLLIITIDILVLGFTYSVLPLLRHTITDTANLVVAVHIMGSRWKTMFPVALILTAFRSAWSRLTMYLHPTNATGKAADVASYLSRTVNSFMRPMRISWLNLEYLDATPATDVIQVVIAAHVFSLCVIHLAKYWINSAGSYDNRKDSESGALRGNRRRADLSGASTQIAAEPSMWDQLLRLKAERCEKGQDIMLQSCASSSSVYLSEVMQKYIVLGICTSQPGEPKVKLSVNGLPWDVSLAQSKCEASEWNLFIDNLSPHTEYDIEVELFNVSATSHLFSICTATKNANILPDLISQKAPISVAEAPLPLEVPANARAVSSLPAIETESLLALASDLEDCKTTLRKLRKEHAKRISSLQREMEHLNARVSSSNEKNEQRLQGRMLSLQTEIKRFQESIDCVEKEKQEVQAARDTQIAAWKSAKEARDREASLLEEVRQRYEVQKLEHQKRFSAVESEANKVRHKADKLSLRRTRIQQELDRLANAQDELLHREQQSRTSARESVKTQRLQAEADWLKAIHDAQQRAELLELYAK